MGKCMYCGQSAGWFSRKHDTCHQQHVEATNTISMLTRQSLIQQLEGNELLPQIEKHAQSGFLSLTQQEKAIATGIADALDHFLMDHMLTEEEEAAIDRHLRFLPVTGETLSTLGLSEQIAKASILRSLGKGEVPAPVLSISGNLPFLFQKSEKLIWLFQDVEYLERRTRAEYRGGSQGVSIRIMKGVYYRTGAFRGHRVEVEETRNIGTGMVALTTKHLYFGSNLTSFKIPYNKIISLQTYSDGIQVQKDGVRSKPQIFKGLDGWFAANLISQMNG